MFNIQDEQNEKGNETHQSHNSQNMPAQSICLEILSRRTSGSPPMGYGQLTEPQPKNQYHESNCPAKKHIFTCPLALIPLYWKTISKIVLHSFASISILIIIPNATHRQSYIFSSTQTKNARPAKARRAHLFVVDFPCGLRLRRRGNRRTARPNHRAGRAPEWRRARIWACPAAPWSPCRCRHCRRTRWWDRPYAPAG